MRLICINNCLDNFGQKVMNFTKGNYYNLTKSIDHEGWEVKDDNGKNEIFFNPYIVFAEI